MASSAVVKRVSKKRKFVSDGLFYAELHAFLAKQLSEEGFSGVEVRVTPSRVEVIIRATSTKEVLGEKGRRIRELTSAVQKRFGIADGKIELYAERVLNRGLSAQAQVESLRYKLLRGLAVRRAAYGVIRFVMEAEAKGVEIIISGKLRSQRAKAMKFRDGYMIKSGQPSLDFVDRAVRSIAMKQGVLGVVVSIMLPSDPTGKKGPKQALPDVVKVLEPKEDAHEYHRAE